MDSEPMIAASGIGKQFGRIRALAEIDLAVPRATVMCLLGHNGAGKTTLVDILATLVRPSSGTARVAGFDVVTQGHQVRRRIGITGQFASLDTTMTGLANLILVARLLGAGRRQARERGEQLLEAFNLSESADRTVGQYSGGMRRRLDIAASLVGEPEVLFLDEPSTGLDPIARQEAWQIVRHLRQSGTTILLTTQDLEEADQLADRITVLAGGRVVTSGTPPELKAQVGRRAVIVTPRTLEQTAVVMAVLAGAGFQPAIDVFRGAVVAPVAHADDLIRAATGLNQAGVDYAALGLGEPTLHDVYLKLAAPDGANP